MPVRSFVYRDQIDGVSGTVACPAYAAFALTIFTAAFLLFEVEPMMGKFLLPWFGGAPSVWTTCVLFFQLLLLGGYAYAHLLQLRLCAMAQARVHITALAACLILMTLLSFTWGTPILPPPSWRPASPAYPSLRIFLTLCATVGLPYLLLSATAPLLQAWLARTSRAAAPYRLYALSNLGAMLGLISYPFAIEPALSLHRQAQLWYSGFVLFTLGLAISGWSLRGCEEQFEPAVGGAVPRSAPGTQLLWFALAACAALMFLAATNQLCQEVAAVPLLWILPLSIYLLSFILCFGSESWYRRAIFNPALAIAMLMACAVLYRSYTGLLWQTAIYSFLVASSCMVCHGELVRLKPDKHHLTRFYFILSAGGAMGGLFGAVAAPWLFRGYWELQVSIWGCAALLFWCLIRDPDSWIHEQRPALALLLLAGAIMMPELMLIGTGHPGAGIYYDVAALGALIIGAGIILRRNDPPATHASRNFLPLSAVAVLIVLASVLLSTVNAALSGNLLSVRNFYGAFAVVERDARDPQWHSYVLRHGRTVHGMQFAQADKRDKPTAYFGPDSAIGLLMLHHPRRLAANADRRSLRVGIVGLGIGTIAAYGRPGDYLRFYEINPAIIRLAAGNGYFTYLRDSLAQVDVVAGDARMSMERELRSGRPQRFDILVVDAFSGDAIPVHLLTKEALLVYLAEMTPEGVLALHISNNYLDLRPVAARLAQSAGMRGRWVHSAASRLTQASDWVLLARNPVILEQPDIAAHLNGLEIDPAVALWTDDYSNLFQILRRPD
jgi:hypothetical protein